LHSSKLKGIGKDYREKGIGKDYREKGGKTEMVKKGQTKGLNKVREEGRKGVIPR
jgi:hypothetical protein